MKTATRSLRLVVLTASWLLLAGGQRLAAQSTATPLPPVETPPLTEPTSEAALTEYLYSNEDEAAGTRRLEAGALIYLRETPNALVLMEDTSDPSRHLDASEFDFDWKAGWELSFGPVAPLQARVMQIDWSASTTVATNSTLLDPLRINNNPAVLVPDVQTIDATYRSDLLGVEVNWTEWSPDGWELMAGFRFVDFGEELLANLDAGPQISTYLTRTQNRLYGLQAGATTCGIWLAGWKFDAGLKMGVFHNSGGQSTRFDTGAAITTATGSSNRAAFLTELRVHAEYPLWETLSLRADYGLLWLETVVLASEQIPATNFTTGGGIDADGGVFFYGGTLGIVCHY